MLSPFKFFVLFAIFSKIILVQAQETFINGSSHLCAKIASGHFDQINLRSITAFRGQKLVIFEGNQKYYVDTTSMKATGLQLSRNEHLWDDNELKTGVIKLIKEKRFKPNDVHTVYMIYFGDKFWPWVNMEGKLFHKWELRADRTKLAALIFTNKTVYVMDIQEERKPKLYREHHNKYAEFAIIHDQNQNGKQKGYVLNKDVYDDTNDLVIYDMDISYSDLEVDIQRTAKRGDLSSSSVTHKFYFLEKGDTANRVKLVPRAVRKKEKGDPKRQLMSSVPRGYSFGHDVFLFDTLLGCVYIIHGLNTTLKFGSTMTFIMDGVPLEKFITCPDFPVVSPFPHQTDRCNLTPEMEPPQEPLGVPDEEEGNYALFWFLGVFIFIFIVVLVGICFKVFLCKTSTVKVEDSKGDSTSVKRSSTSNQKSSSASLAKNCSPASKKEKKSSTASMNTIKTAMSMSTSKSIFTA